MALRGRHWVAFWLIAVLGALWFVVWRQTDGLRMARALGDTRSRRLTLEGKRSEYERRIREAESRAVLIPRAERLGLRESRDTDIVLFPLPAADSGRP